MAIRHIISLLAAAVTCSANGSISVGSAQADTLASGTSIGVSYTATTGNTLVVACFSYGSIASHTITDGTNTYTTDKFQSFSASQERVSLAHSASITGGTRTITCTANATAPNGMTINVAEYPSGVTGTVDGTPSGSTSISTGLVDTGGTTTSHANDLLISAVVGSGSPGQFLAFPPWTILKTLALTNLAASALLEQVVTSTGTYSASITQMPQATRLTAVVIAYQCTCAVPPDLSASHATTIISSSSANWAQSLNTTTPATNSLATCSGIQFIGWYDTSTLPVLHVTSRVMATGVTTDYNTGIALVNNDEHRAVALACDKNGYIQMAYGMHDSALLYRRSVAPLDPSAFTALLPMLGGSVEIQVTYPMFTKNPSTGELYFFFRSGFTPGNGSYFYHYDAALTTWEKATGTDSAPNPGRVINGYTGGSPDYTAYLNGIPKWDPSLNLWFSWIMQSDNDQVQHNQYVMYWNGTAFKKFDGSAQTIPATISNITAVLTCTPSTNQSQFSIDSAGTLFIPYPALDGGGALQVFVAESSTGSFIAHQLTSNAGTTTANTIPAPYPTAVSIGTRTFVVHQDPFDVYKGLVSWVSPDNFTSVAKQYVVNGWNPNMSFNYDPDALVNKRLSFLFGDTNDTMYGAIYVSAGFPSAGQLSLIDWLPIQSGALRGVSALRGKGGLRP